MAERAPQAIDARTARRHFERSAATYAAASRVEAQTGERMLERLDYVKLSPRCILDAGAGPAREARALRARYRTAQVVALDFSLAMLRRARAQGGALERLGARLRGRPSAPLALCARLERLPLADGTVELVWSNMALHWVADPLAVLRELGRVLTSGGLLMLSTLGPDTLRELRSAAGAGRVHVFTDMHDLGDMLVAAGFSSPVMDMEMVTLRYARAEQLLEDLRASGQTLARVDRARGLAGRGFARRLQAALAQQAHGGHYEASFEVIYGHAWKLAARSASGGRAIVHTDFRRRKGN